MSEGSVRKDLVVLTACKNAQFTIRGLLSRSKSIGFRQIQADYFVHPEKDPGVLQDSPNFMRPFFDLYRHALIVMDRVGCGQEKLTRDELEKRIEDSVNGSGWDGRATAVVIDPELEIWVWTDSPHVPIELGWANRAPGLTSWLKEKNWLAIDALKPSQPKEALEAVLRVARRPRSSALYLALAEKVSLVKCKDLAFAKLKATLQSWFAEI